MISYLMVHHELHNLACAHRTLLIVPGDSCALESRQSEANRVALEKNSNNFLEFVIRAV